MRTAESPLSKRSGRVPESDSTSERQAWSIILLGQKGCQAFSCTRAIAHSAGCHPPSGSLADISKGCVRGVFCIALPAVDSVLPSSRTYWPTSYAPSGLLNQILFVPAAGFDGPGRPTRSRRTSSRYGHCDRRPMGYRANAQQRNLDTTVLFPYRGTAN